MQFQIDNGNCVIRVLILYIWFVWKIAELNVQNQFKFEGN